MFLASMQHNIEEFQNLLKFTMSLYPNAEPEAHRFSHWWVHVSLLLYGLGWSCRNFGQSFKFNSFTLMSLNTILAVVAFCFSFPFSVADLDLVVSSLFCRGSGSVLICTYIENNEKINVSLKKLTVSKMLIIWIFVICTVHYSTVLFLVRKDRTGRVFYKAYVK